MTRSILLYLLLVSSLAARLGESLPTLVERFGDPTSVINLYAHYSTKKALIGKNYIFKSDDINITCSLIDGRCARIIYQKPGPLTDSQIGAFLNANAQGAIWTEYTSEKTKNIQRLWKRTDGGKANWLSTSGITIINPAYERAIKTGEAKAKADYSKTPKI